MATTPALSRWMITAAHCFDRYLAERATRNNTIMLTAIRGGNPRFKVTRDPANFFLS